MAHQASQCWFSVAWSDQEYFNPLPLDGVLVHTQITPALNLPVPNPIMATRFYRGTVRVKCLTGWKDLQCPTKIPSWSGKTNYGQTRPKMQDLLKVGFYWSLLCMIKKIVRTSLSNLSKFWSANVRLLIVIYSPVLCWRTWHIVPGQHLNRNSSVWSWAWGFLCLHKTTLWCFLLIWHF